MNIPSLMTKAGVLLAKNSPALLTAAGIVGVATTSVLAVRATPKALELLDEYRILESERIEIEPEEVQINIVDMIQLCWREYIPAVSAGIISAACIIGSHSIHVQRQAALLGAYSLAEKSLVEYKQSARELLTEHQEQKIQTSADQKAVDNSIHNNNSSVIITGGGEQLCYESWTGRYFKSDIEQIRRAMNDINEEINTGSYASLNMFFDKIGLDPTSGGYEVGWTIDHTMDLNFSTVLSPDGKPCISIGYSNRMPMYKFDSMSGW